MRDRKRKSLLLLCCLFVTVSAHAQSSTQDVEVDMRLAQETAQHFVKRFQETRDLEPLISDMFQYGFAPRLECNDESMNSSLYAKLTSSERLRLFIVQVNVAYMVTIDVIQGTDYIGNKPETIAFSRILEPEMAQRLRELLKSNGSPLGFSEYKDFQSRLAKIEIELSNARACLKKRGLEQTSLFQEKLRDTITGKGLHYRVRVFGNKENVLNCWNFEPIPNGRKFFRVETPLHLSLIFAKDGSQMRIFHVSDADVD